MDEFIRMMGGKKHSKFRLDKIVVSLVFKKKKRR